jgi:hypothetical protein
MSILAQQSGWRRAGRVIAALMLGYGYASALLCPQVYWDLPSKLPGYFAVGLGLLIAWYLAILGNRTSFRQALEALLLVVLPVSGFLINVKLPVADYCDDENRLLAMPQLVPFYGAYGVTVLAYVVARLRPTGLTARAELCVQALLLFGMAQMLALILQFHFLPLLGALLAPLGLPLVAPHGVFVLYLLMLRSRMNQFHPTPENPSAVKLHVGPWVLTSVLMGIYGLLHAAWRGSSTGAFEVFTQTAAGTFGTVVPPWRDCHYLCTVAAQGSPSLVRPERWGVRRGKPILVNRQLAVANAFEDLLHERWPRFGKFARRTYDLLAFPISRYLCRRWAANLIYLLMKPAEWLFYFTLVLFDPGQPEKRIDRMYR